MSYRLIVSVDFDGTIVDALYPEIGKPKKHAFRVLKYFKEKLGCILILNTCRHGEKLEEAVKFLKDNNFEFDYVNENAEHMIALFGDSRKVFARIYIDDCNLEFANKELDWLDIESRVKGFLKNKTTQE